MSEIFLFTFHTFYRIAHTVGITTLDSVLYRPSHCLVCVGRDGVSFDVVTHGVVTLRLTVPTPQHGDNLLASHIKPPLP